MNTKYRDADLLILTYIAWVVFDILFGLCLIISIIYTWKISVENYSNGFWALIPLGVGIVVDILINLKFNKEILSYAI